MIKARKIVENDIGLLKWTIMNIFFIFLYFLESETTAKKKVGAQVTTATSEYNLETGSNAMNDDCLSPSTEYSSEVCYDSMFDLRVCDKYYISEDPTTFQRFRLFCKKVSESTKVSYFIMGVIVVNTVCMAVEHHNQVRFSTYSSVTKWTSLTDQ